MRRPRTWTGPALIVSLVTLGLSAAYWAAPVSPIRLTAIDAQDTPASDQSARDVARNPTGPKYTGVGSCSARNCHGSADPRNDHRVLQNEVTTWQRDQSHHIDAYQNLLAPDKNGLQIAQNLGWIDPNLNDDQARDKWRQLLEEAGQARTKVSLCLDCHAIDTPPNRRGEQFDIREGVSCEACHGPAGSWREQHKAQDATHEGNVRLGMIDTKDPVRRAELCMACHLGTPAKQVDHPLIAAGHPDLKFELQTFEDIMPPHWSTKQGEQDRPGTFTGRAWAAGQAVGFRQGMELSAARARRPKTWPDFADFECTACHHNLGTTWRQERFLDPPSIPRGAPRIVIRRPGSLPWQASKFAVYRELVNVVAPRQRQALDAAVQKYVDLLGRAGGDPRDVAVEAERIADQADQLVGQVARRGYPPEVLRGVLVAISGEGDYLASLGFQTVQQAYYSLASLQSDLPNPDPRIDQVLGALQKALGSVPYDPDPFMRQFRQIHQVATGR